VTIRAEVVRAGATGVDTVVWDSAFLVTDNYWITLPDGVRAKIVTLYWPMDGSKEEVHIRCRVS